MPQFGLVLRWVLSVPVFAACSLIGFTLAVSAAKSLGADVAYANLAGFALGTICGALAGVLTAPPQHRRLATHLFIGVVVIYLVYSAVSLYPARGFPIGQQLALLGAIIGGIAVYATLGRAYPDGDRAGSREAEKTRQAIRWSVALLVAPLAYFTTYVLALFCSHWTGGGLDGYKTAVTLAATAGVAVGVLVIPPQHRGRGIWLFVGAAMLMPGWGILRATLDAQFRAANALDLICTIGGCLTVVHLTRRLRRMSGANPAATATQPG